VKGQPQDYFVLRDQFWASEPLHATYCLHVRSDRVRRDSQTIELGNLSLFCAYPDRFEFGRLPWSHDNGGREATQGARLTVRAEQGEFITVLYPGRAPMMLAVEDGVRVGSDEILFGGGLASSDRAMDDAVVYVAVSRDDRTVASLTKADIDLHRSQGEIGLFVPDAGYPFGEIPDWLIRQRSAVPDWAPSHVKQLRKYEQR
jgi:hypothetical protein